jgi:hypothetical protein
MSGTDINAPVASVGTRPGRTAFARIALRRDILVGDDHDATVRLARSIIERGSRGMDSQILAGDVEHVAEQMASFEPVGVDDIVARAITVDQPTALRSIEPLADVRAAIA